MNFITKHPRMTYLGTGIVIAALAVALTSSLMGDQVDIYQEQLRRLESKYESVTAKYEKSQSKISEMNKTIKESFEEIIKPDGTKITRSKKDHSESQRVAIEKTIRSEYQKKLESKIVEINERSGSNKKLIIAAGVDTNLNIYGVANYNVTSVVVTGIKINQDGTVGVHAGIRF